MTRLLRHRWLVATTVAILAIAAWLGATVSNPDDGVWVRVERRDLVVGCNIEGELQAVDSVELGPPQIRDVWDFRVSFLAPEGSEVSEGDPVLGFDTTQLVQQLQDTTAERDAAEKELEKKVTDLEIERRNLELTLAEARGRLRRAELKLDVPEDVAPRAELERARIDHRLAVLEIRHTESRLEHLARGHSAELTTMRERRDRAVQRVRDIESHIARMTVRAPRAGTVIYKSNWRGEKKKIGDSTWRGEKVLEIPDLRRMLAHGEVNEADAGRIREGQEVTLHLEAHPDMEYGATVRRIHRSVQTKSWRDPRKVVRVEIELDRTDQERMRPGMRFRGSVEAERIADTLVVPHGAVSAGAEGATVVVRGLLGRREVHPLLGRHNDELYAVEKGLDEGDRVLLRTIDGEVDR